MRLQELLCNLKVFWGFVVSPFVSAASSTEGSSSKRLEDDAIEDIRKRSCRKEDRRLRRPMACSFSSLTEAIKGPSCSNTIRGDSSSAAVSTVVVVSVVLISRLDKSFRIPDKSLLSNITIHTFPIFRLHGWAMKTTNGTAHFIPRFLCLFAITVATMPGRFRSKRNCTNTHGRSKTRFL